VTDRERDDEAEAPADVVQAVADFVDALVDDPVDGTEPAPAD
jgi:hypothetical protein